MSSNRKMIYIGGGRDIVETLSKTEGIGIEIHYIQHEKKFNPQVRPYIYQTHFFDYENFELLKQKGLELKEKLSPVSVFSLNETALTAAAYLREVLGLTGNSLATVEMLKNKQQMRSFLNSKNFSPVEFALGQTESEIKSFFQMVQGPIFIKPTDSSGSFSVFKIERLEQIPLIYGSLVENKIETFLMEEFLEGPEVSVEAFTDKGQHAILSVTEKITLSNFVEKGHIVPGRFALEMQNQVALFVKQFLDLIQIRCGPTHTEVKMTPKGLRIIESHDRTGGDRLNELVRYSTGVDMKKLAFQQAVGITLPPIAEGKFLKASSIEFLTPEPGLIREIAGIEDAKRSAGVEEVHLYLKVGEIRKEIRDSLDRSGYVIACGETPQLALDRVQAAASRIKFV